MFKEDLDGLFIQFENKKILDVPTLKIKMPTHPHKKLGSSSR